MQVMTEIKTLPKLRFGEFKDEWKKQSLGKLTVKVNKKKDWIVMIENMT